ncbi:MAG: glycosyltransferase family 2 protein [Hyphomicrobiaceae bacterium]
MLIAAELVLVVMWLRLAVLCVLGIVGAWRSRDDRRLLAQPVADGWAPRVSVVIPALNEEATIEATLLSLFQQDLVPWEIIVVDDGSDDATSEIARRCLATFERGMVIELAVNAGKAEALNTGVRAASGAYIATIDADTRIERGGLQSAARSLHAHDAGAVAFYLTAESGDRVLERLQRQEYAAGLNFERAGQHVIGAISILPGAATLYRRELLLEVPFSLRTRTEDADHTLQLARRGVRLVLDADAVAMTVVPATWRDLIAQRIRWTAGHLQCCLAHLRASNSAHTIFRAVVLPNFVVSTWIVAVGFVAMLTVLAGGHTPLFQFGWFDAAAITVFLVYLQRGSACLVNAKHQPRLADFVMEPFVTNIIGSVSFIGASYVLLRPSRVFKPVVRFPLQSSYTKPHKY